MVIQYINFIVGHLKHQLIVDQYLKHDLSVNQTQLEMSLNRLVDQLTVMTLSTIIGYMLVTKTTTFWT